jgi:hypothetical protein
MKYRLLYLTPLLLLFCSQTKAQNDCGNQFWGSSFPYPFSQALLTPTPEEYVPVFVNYVGRYGSSHLQKDVFASFTFKTLEKADSAHALKDEGKKLRQMLLVLESVEKNKLGTLSLSGSEEMKAIGEHIYKNYSNAFKPGNCVKVSAVNDQRMLQSAAALLTGMGRSIDAPGCDKPDLKDDDNLAPFTVSPALKTFAEKGDWKDVAADYRESKKPKNFNTKFLGRFFSTDFLEALDDDAQDRFIADMYNLSLVTASITIELQAANLTSAQVDIRSFFSCDDLQMLCNANSAGEFFKSAAGNDKEGMQVRSAVPLAMNLINTTDAYSVGGTVAADVRLTSEESIAALATLLDFKGYNKVSTSDTKVDKIWKAEEVIPYAANIQMVFYKGTTADTRTYFLVRFLLNETEVQIEGVKPHTMGVYYLWDDVKAYYLKKLNEEFDVDNRNDNMHTYLLKLKP